MALTSRKTYDKASAMGFASTSEHQDDCYYFINYNHKDLQSKLTKHYLAELITNPKLLKCKPKYHNSVVAIALYEVKAPHKATIRKYNYSSNQRASACGIAKQTWSDNKLSKYVEHIIDDIKRNEATVNQLIEVQETPEFLYLRQLLN